MKRIAKAVWNGSGTEGSGTLSTPQSKAFTDLPYSVKLRFENEDGTKGTNPEELIAAAHAGCYAMALSVGLEKQGYSADTIETKATLSLEQKDGGWAITKIALQLDAKVPDISEDKFDEIAKASKEGCPVSKLLNAEITLDYTLN